MIKKYHIENGRVSESGDVSSNIFVYINPNDDEKRYLVDELKVDEHTLNSALDPDELSRLEFEPDHLALIYKRPKNYSSQDNFLFRVASTGVFLFKDKLLVVIADDIPLFTGKQFSKLVSIQDVMLRLIGSSIYHYYEHLKVIHLISDSIEEKINISMENSHLLNMFTLEKSLVYYLNAINSNSVLIMKLKANNEKIGLTRENAEMLEDIAIENNQCYRQADIYSNILSGMMDARASIVNNNLNTLIKTLNIITIVIMVPTLIVSIFSMNVKIPLADFHYAFWVIVGIALFSASAFTFVWKWKNKK